MNEDKYPPESGRRRFVKGVVGSSVLAGVGTGGAVALDSATSAPGGSGGPTDYIGIENTAGPAPRGMPMVPLTIDGDGYLKGIWPELTEKELDYERTATVAEEQLGEVAYSGQWFQYCGAQTAPGVEPGRKLHVDDFDDYEEWTNGIGSAGAGKPAQTTWRSQSGEDEKAVKELPVQVLRSPTVADLPAESEHGEFLEAATESDFMPWLDICTHFCCTPGFNHSTDASKFGAVDKVYCQCHQSVYDPFSPVELSFNAFPRPD
jgi:Rieske Fe-S protein